MESEVKEISMYRRFSTEIHEDGKSFDIIEHEPTDVHPTNWMDGKTSREGAWAAARAQALPVVVRFLDGTSRCLGVVFDSGEFERVCYGGYVSYGYSMSDGYYAPISFDSWVGAFRSNPERELAHNNDAPAYARDEMTLNAYQEARAA